MISQNLIRWPIAVGIAAVTLAALSMAVAQDKPSPFEGRWSQIKQEQGSGHFLAVGTLDIAPCGNALCGRVVKGETCGPMALTFEAKEGAAANGTLKLASKDFVAIVPALSKQGLMTLLASEGPAFISRSGMGMMAHLSPDGPSRCPKSPST